MESNEFDVLRGYLGPVRTLRDAPSLDLFDRLKLIEGFYGWESPVFEGLRVREAQAVLL